MEQLIKQKVIQEIDNELRNESGFRYVTQRVADKSKEVLNNINDKYFKYVDYEHDVYATPYHTCVVDFLKDKNLFSLEIGYNSIGYFTEINGEGHKCIDRLYIDDNDKMKSVIEQIESDLDILF